MADKKVIWQWEVDCVQLFYEKWCYSFIKTVPKLMTISTDYSPNNSRGTRTFKRKKAETISWEWYLLYS